MNIKCLIVDDDDLSRGILEDLVNDTDRFDLIKSCGDSIDAFNFLKDNVVDVVFLDVEMPKMDGLELLENLNKLPQIILVTSHAKYAVESYEHDVTDFIQKPITYSRFLKSVNKIIERYEDKQVKTSSKNRTIFIKSDSKFIQINIDEIFWIQAKGNYIQVYTSNGKFLVLSTMKDMRARLPDSEFIRVHRSFIVRIDKIQSIEDNYLVINNKQVIVGRSYKDRLDKKLNML
jgi:DNA-binding LytR/AlgR family response regulator